MGDPREALRARVEVTTRRGPSCLRVGDESMTWDQLLAASREVAADDAERDAVAVLIETSRPT